MEIFKYQIKRTYNSGHVQVLHGEMVICSKKQLILGNVWSNPKEQWNWKGYIIGTIIKDQLSIKITIGKKILKQQYIVNRKYLQAMIDKKIYTISFLYDEMEPEYDELTFEWVEKYSENPYVLEKIKDFILNSKELLAEPETVRKIEKF